MIVLVVRDPDLKILQNLTDKNLFILNFIKFSRSGSNNAE